jgi:hypothetical protein
MCKAIPDLLIKDESRHVKLNVWTPSSGATDHWNRSVKVEWALFAWPARRTGPAQGSAEGHETAYR